MVYLSNIKSINSTSTLSTDENTYYFTNTSSITVTLPTPNANGIEFKLVMSNATLTNIITITATGSLIYTDSTTSSSSITINSPSYLEFSSIDGNWYIFKLIPYNSQATQGFMSTIFAANNQNPYIVLTGNGSDYIMHSAYNPSINPIPRRLIVVVTLISQTPSGNIQLANSTGIFFTATGITPTPSNEIFDFVITGTPTFVAEDFISARWVGTSGGGGAKVGLCSLFIA